MPSLAHKLLACVIGLAFVFAAAAPADAAKSRKHKKVARVQTTAQVQGKHRGTDIFPAGPLFFSGVYLGDDPDPNIRFQLWRDLSGRLGGED